MSANLKHFVTPSSLESNVISGSPQYYTKKENGQLKKRVEELERENEWLTVTQASGRTIANSCNDVKSLDDLGRNLRSTSIW